MAEMKMDELILRFFKEDIGGILITGQNGEILYEDEKTSFIRTEKTNWESACPEPRDGQKGGERLPRTEGRTEGRTLGSGAL